MYDAEREAAELTPPQANPPPRFAIAQALRRAYAAGQADMRERAVSLVEEFNGERFTPHKDFLVDETIIGAWKNGIDDCALWAANDLRALPITPEPKETRLN